jgi:hypothetical protein
MTEADLLRENAELTASNARKREALSVICDPHNWDGIYLPKIDCQVIAEGALLESPAASLAAIQDAARAEEKKACAAQVESFTDWTHDQYFSRGDVMWVLGLAAKAVRNRAVAENPK